MVGTRKSAKKAWRTRRKRYGKNGLMDTPREAIETVRAIRKGTQRRRPSRGKKKVYYKGDQIRPLGKSRSAMAQWKRTKKVDSKKDGSGYENWERTRVKARGFPKGLDRYGNEWAHVNDPRPKRKKIMKVM